MGRLFSGIEGLCPLMATQVSEEATAPTEAQATLLALKWLLLSVDLLVLMKV